MALPAIKVFLPRTLASRLLPHQSSTYRLLCQVHDNHTNRNNNVVNGIDNVGLRH